MITTEAALAQLFDLVDVLPSEDVPLRMAAGRVLARNVTANRDQPPFAASAMDGYAVCGAAVGATFDVIGEAAAGHAFAGRVDAGQAVRIFTGAPVPEGADRVVIQEDVTRKGDAITLNDTLEQARYIYIRPAGGDFTIGTPLKGPRTLTPSDIALLASMNISTVPVIRKPVVAIIATGDELVQPGETPNDAQIIASNSYGLAALFEANGATVQLLPIARDAVPALELAFELAHGADLIITIGGASVGDHDLVGQVAKTCGMDRAFYKVAMRPGKPLMAGRMGTSAMIGLPGNPVSAMVCGHIFVLPVIRKMLALGAQPAPRQTATLINTLNANGPREHYMRAHLGPDGVRVFDRQDSALLSVLSNANCLAIRPANDGTRLPGDLLEIITI